MADPIIATIAVGILAAAAALLHALFAAAVADARRFFARPKLPGRKR